MNVAFDPWIPVVTEKGENRLVSLCSIFTEGKRFSDLSVRPHERVSLMRLFLCVAHAALNGPKDFDEWKAVPDQLDKAAAEYLEKWKDSFELFHPTKPWLQVENLKPSGEGPDKYTPVSKLDFSLGVSLTNHFQNNVVKMFSNAQLALGILTLQNFSTCGLLSMPIWENSQTAKSANDAPCISSSVYHVFIIRENLYETICVNICDFHELSFLYGNKIDFQGKPIWEYSTISRKDDFITKTFLGRLVPLSRAILLKEGSPFMLYGEALKYPSFPAFPREFNTSEIKRTIKKKEINVLVGAKLGIRPWRQLNGILQYDLKDSLEARAAINLGHCRDEPIDIWVGTLVRNPGKQDILDTVESRFHVSNKLRSQEGCSAYTAGTESAYILSKKLDLSVYIYRTKLDPSENTGIGIVALTYYWTAVEKNLSLLFSCIEKLGSNEFEQTEKVWHNMLFSAACDAYRTACGQETPREIKAFAAGWQKLTAKKEQKEHDETNKEDDDE